MSALLYSDLDLLADAVIPLAVAFTDREARRGTPAWDGIFGHYIEDALSPLAAHIAKRRARSAGWLCEAAT